MNPKTEINLIERLTQGDESAMSEIYRLYRERIYGFIYRMTINREIAEDLTHEVFIRLIEYPERFQAERGSKLLTFLCAIARNLVMNHLRRKFNREVEFDEFESFDDLQPQMQNNPLKDLLCRELAARIEICIAALPPVQREAIVLREFQELSYEEIARVTESDLNAVKVRLHRARQTLARQLADYVNTQKEKCYELH